MHRSENVLENKLNTSKLKAGESKDHPIRPLRTDLVSENEFRHFSRLQNKLKGEYKAT